MAAKVYEDPMAAREHPQLEAEYDPRLDTSYLLAEAHFSDKFEVPDKLSAKVLLMYEGALKSQPCGVMAGLLQHYSPRAANYFVTGELTKAANLLSNTMLLAHSIAASQVVISNGPDAIRKILNESNGAAACRCSSWASMGKTSPIKWMLDYPAHAKTTCIEVLSAAKSVEVDPVVMFCVLGDDVTSGDYFFQEGDIGKLRSLLGKLALWPRFASALTDAEERLRSIM